MLAVRSNCRPAWIEKLAVSTTFAHGPGQAAGGVYWKGLGLKSANLKLLNSETTQGVVFGRGTGGSAVAVLGEPICSWADAKTALKVRTASIQPVRVSRGREKFIGPPGGTESCRVESFLREQTAAGGVYEAAAPLSRSARGAPSARNPRPRLEHASPIEMHRLTTFQRPCRGRFRARPELTHNDASDIEARWYIKDCVAWQGS